MTGPIDLDYSQQVESIQQLEAGDDSTVISQQHRRKRKNGLMKLSSYGSILFFVSLLLVSSEALATTFGSTSARSKRGISQIHRGGSLSASTSTTEAGELSDEEQPFRKAKVNGANGSSSAKTQIGLASQKGFGTTLISSLKQRNDSSHTFEEDPPHLILPSKYIAETNLPTDIGHFRLRAYRMDDVVRRKLSNKYVGSEPCVIYCTDKPPFGRKNAGAGATNVPVRIHDQCFTSEVFRSQRCDCKEQLKMSLEYIKENGGAIIYLQQEGRGIGLANKVAAYALQDAGMDTVDANTHLGFPEDCRQYGVVPSILHDMGIDSIKLITNNPRKIERLQSLGVDVQGTVPMVVERANPHNRKYLQTKQDRMAHDNFGDMLSLDNREESVNNLVNGAVTSLLSGMDSVAEDYINGGEEMAAAAVTSALLDEFSDSDVEDYNSQAGVTAADDGYCFGRKSVEDAVAAIARGEIVVVVDDMDRENEGDFIMAADLATPETIATIIRYSSGVICIGMEGDRMDELKLPAMIDKNEDPKGTAFSVTVDATEEHGITTGISALDRATSLQLLAKSTSVPTDFARPGHIFPLRAREGGVLSRDGHTEAAVDLSRLAGRHPSGVLCEIVSEENPVEMARVPELKRFCKKHGFVLTSIVDIAQYRRDTEE
jgi:3,4-dihydroxy 2-butanone 4-phosphate synthase/GTP cyclohydrolase II